jgi:hypothetical protein
MFGIGQLVHEIMTACFIEALGERDDAGARRLTKKFRMISLPNSKEY